MRNPMILAFGLTTLATLVACNGGKVHDPCNDSGYVAVDADRDGYFADDGCVEEPDCDDADADTYPGAAELEPGRDNTLCMTDADNDGYGDVNASGPIDAGTDCDDADPVFNPGAAEDDCTDPNDYNCDGSVGYTDGDGDGFAACEDCDDANELVNPAMSADWPGDRVDQDCDGENPGLKLIATATSDGKVFEFDAATWGSTPLAEGYINPIALGMAVDGRSIVFGELSGSTLQELSISGGSDSVLTSTVSSPIAVFGAIGSDGTSTNWWISQYLGGTNDQVTQVFADGTIDTSNGVYGSNCEQMLATVVGVDGSIYSVCRAEDKLIIWTSTSTYNVLDAIPQPQDLLPVGTDVLLISSKDNGTGATGTGAVYKYTISDDTVDLVVGGLTTPRGMCHASDDGSEVFVIADGDILLVQVEGGGIRTVLDDSGYDLWKCQTNYPAMVPYNTDLGSSGEVHVSRGGTNTSPAGL